MKMTSIFKTTLNMKTNPKIKITSKVRQLEIMKRAGRVTLWGLPYPPFAAYFRSSLLLLLSIFKVFLYDI